LVVDKTTFLVEQMKHYFANALGLALGELLRHDPQFVQRRYALPTLEKIAALAARAYFSFLSPGAQGKSFELELAQILSKLPQVPKKPSATSRSSRS
jgi:hypothetical protein